MNAPIPLLAVADRLTGALRLLRERIRDAVAAEVGLAAGQTMQSFLQALIRGVGPRLGDPAEYRGQSESDRDDDREGDRVGDREHDDDPIPERPHRPDAPPPPAGLGVRLLTLCRSRRGSAWATLGAGLLTGLLAWCGSPALVASALAAAAECLVLSRWTAASAAG